MVQVKLTLLGAPTLDLGDGLPRRLPTQRSASLLGFLAVHPGRWHSREAFATMLYEDRSESSARKCLRTDLWRLGSLLKPATGEAPLVVTREAVLLNPGRGLWIDIAAFTELAGAPMGNGGGELADEQVRRFNEAVAIYRGDLLEGCSDPWCLSPREQFRTLRITCLERLFAHHRTRGAGEAAAECVRRILEREPLLEQAHYDLMLCLYEMGNRNASLRQFTVCAQLLQSELGVEPMPAMVQLYRRIRDNSQPIPARHDRVEPPPSNGSAVLDQLQTFKGRLDEMQKQLESIMGEVTRLLLTCLAVLPVKEGLP